MKWSWKLGRIAGILIQVHSTFFILLGWVALDSFLRERSVLAAIDGVLFILTLFGIVVLHELGHALAARRYGIPTHDITLLPIGGVARLERMPDNPKHELVVALAGPAVNVVLAAGLVVGIIPFLGTSALMDVTLIEGNFFIRLLWVNVMLAVFNLLPAFPMDGGRVLRAVLAMKTKKYVRATEIAALVGKVMAILFAVVGVFKNPFLVLIAIFVWFGATQETRMARAKFVPRPVPVSRPSITLSPNDLLADVVSHVLRGFQQDFPIVENGYLVAVLTRSDLLRALARHGPNIQMDEIIKITRHQFRVIE